MLDYKFLFYIEQNYSFEILRPLQSVMKAHGYSVAWLAIGNEVNINLFHADEEVLNDIQSAIEFQPDACFVPGNIIPNFISGLKVQVFHGLEWKKKGHFVIRGCFDLYCTHGPATTERFNQLANEHGYFDVVETGWPKLDPLFTTEPFKLDVKNKPVILFAPTFSPKLTCAGILFEQIKNLVNKQDWLWLAKFHPKMNPELVQLYQSIESDNFKVIDTSDIASLLQVSDVMLSDTSSVIGEFALLNKPIVSFKNSEPGNYLIDIDDPVLLEGSIVNALTPTDDLKGYIADYARELHPLIDGLASERILADVVDKLNHGIQAKRDKPLNLFRNLKLRKQLHYWKY